MAKAIVIAQVQRLIPDYGRIAAFRELSSSMPAHVPSVESENAGMSLEHRSRVQQGVFSCFNSVRLEVLVRNDP